MWCNFAALCVFIAGIIMMITSVVMGNTIQTEMATLGIDAYINQYGPFGWLRFMLFAFGFPLGLGISALVVVGYKGKTWGRLLWLSFFLVCVLLLPILVPLIFGRQLGTLFFSVGGYAILGVVVATVWFWGAHRRRLPQEERLAADLQGTGYLCFAMAAWNLCGVGAMPSFALSPERMLALGSQGFAIGQTKTVMVLLLLGWIFTAVGYYYKTYQSGSH